MLTSMRRCQDHAPWTPVRPQKKIPDLTFMSLAVQVWGAPTISVHLGIVSSRQSEGSKGHQNVAAKLQVEI